MKATESEKYVLGTCINFPERFGSTLPHVSAANFGDELHRRIFSKFVQQYASVGSIDPMLVARELGEAGYFLELKDLGLTTEHVPTQAAKIVDAHNKRCLAEAAEHALKGCANGRVFETVLYELKNSIEDLERSESSEQQQFTFRELRQQYPQLRPPVVEGIGRSGEVINIISHSKAGKSWFAYLLALCIIIGRNFLERFPATAGRVLYIDNELHRETIVYRVTEVAGALGLDAGDFERDLIIWPMRGRLRAFHDIADELLRTEPGGYRAIIFDSKYRFATQGVSESDNTAETLFGNRADEIAAHTGSLLAFIHHASKGDQSNKRVADVGSGAGSQSRTVDTHLIIREHEQEGFAVLDAVMRSFPPIAPIALAWNFPLWMPAEHIDPTKLKGKLNNREQKQVDRDREATHRIIDAIRKDGPATARQLRKRTGLSRERQQRLLDSLEADGHLTTTEIIHRGNPCYEYHLA